MGNCDGFVVYRTQPMFPTYVVLYMYGSQWHYFRPRFIFRVLYILLFKNALLLSIQHKRTVEINLGCGF